MRAIILMGLLLFAPTADAQDECPDFGIENDYLERHFCEQVQGIISQSGEDRSSWPAGSEPNEDVDNAPWRRLGMLDEAYGRDPKKTLVLIERIRAAGGLEVTQ